MAKPIASTPPVSGEDALRLVQDMQQHASPAEIERRRAIARDWMSQNVLPILNPSHAR
jgi:hypothetical protein